MLDSVIEAGAAQAPRPIMIVAEASFEVWQAAQPAPLRAWLHTTAFTGKPGQVALVPADSGGLGGAVLAVDDRPDLWSFADLPKRLPAGVYRVAAGNGVVLDRAVATAAALGWMIGSYSFDRYGAPKDGTKPTLAAPREADLPLARRLARAVGVTRDLINTPANDLGPEELDTAARETAREFGAVHRAVVGEELLDQGYPMIHAVGRGSAREPRLIELAWGADDAPKVTLVGKGICFDSGGLDLKTASGMRLMKKDMGGAAHMLALAGAVMDAGLGLRLRLLIPAVENSVSGLAFRPGDVIPTRAGKMVEIGNTDAEGRLVLCDALAEADREAPALLIDMATLTGAARVALGTDVAALFCNDEVLADALAGHAHAQSDPLWRLPLWRPYRRNLDSDIADLNNVSEGPYGGAITAALFLQEFVDKAGAWAHFDIMAWNRAARPGRPKGGEALALRALYAYLAERFPA